MSVKSGPLGHVAGAEHACPSSCDLVRVKAYLVLQRLFLSAPSYPRSYSRVLQLLGHYIKGSCVHAMQLLETGLLHADPHPGNLIRTPDGRICILDFGLMTEVPPERAQALVEYIAHLSVEDFEAVVMHDLPALGFIPPGARERFRTVHCGHRQGMFCSGPGTSSQMNTCGGYLAVQDMIMPDLPAWASLGVYATSLTLRAG